ncbi:histidine--tRNA ligase [Nitrospirillum sp. BR 11828]|uniref:histidine--tRNA ligase n=1 Tax=Nitrospirillum sp. BR 11828 TaxID=3104325 RepID=UPI002ACA33CA|nr:histidine--tRNA ligase [Nitrospirillum sp. BR 11828]MDZ5646237.1 histidine--tRNA ligase [Nitrospirillum sp. BR 11828]
MALIAPRTPPGTMELLPSKQIAFQRMLDTIRRGYERFGFLQIETPVFETVDVLLTKSGGETEKQIYFVQSTGALEQAKRPDIALRFDLTVPTARYVAEHEHDLSFPFRRYQIQRVYRGERAQKGRYREFYQCDIDVIGKDSLSVAYDAEMPAVIYTVFRDLAAVGIDVGPFQINLSNRKILRGFLEGLGLTEGEAQAAVLREIDKLPKVGVDAVRATLTGEQALSAGTADAILAFVGIDGTTDEMLAKAKELAGASATAQEGLAELTQVVTGLRALGVPDSHFRVNFSITRGLDYYTGTVYETFLTDFPQMGSVCSGGRYDNLASQYTKSKLPGVGISIGATRLFYVLDQAGLVKDQTSTIDVLVTQFAPELLPDYLALAGELRTAGLNVEVHLEPAKIAKQMKYADRAGIPVVLMMGPDEKAAGTVTVKRLASGEQAAVARADLPGHLLASFGRAR